MANGTLRKFILGCNQQIIGQPKQRCRTIVYHHNKLHTATVPFKEIKIPVPWGHIAGKLWGNDQQRPVLALHGWLDNAGTWDTLAPMICDKLPILAIDFPGHGFSSSFPLGMNYDPFDYSRLILKVKNYFKWDKISILGHSLGSISGMRYAGIFPDSVDFLIAFDNHVYKDYDLDDIISVLTKSYLTVESCQTLLELEPPSFSMDEIIKRWHFGTNKSISKESVRHLVKRGVKPSSTDPNKFYFSRDIRLKNFFITPENKEFIEHLIRRHKVPSLSFRASDTYKDLGQFCLRILEILKENPNFENHIIPGTHHVHLNNPEKVAPLIIKFLKNHSFI